MAKYRIIMECPYSQMKVTRAIADLCNGTLFVGRLDGTDEVQDRFDHTVATIEEIEDES